jgi:hypothetical protein
MDGLRFDRLSKALAGANSRRSLVQAVAALALAGIPALPGDGAAARRGKRGGVGAEHFRHKKAFYCLNGETVRRYRRKQEKLLAMGATLGKCGAVPCAPDSDAITCAGRCGNVRNNCGTTVNCGSCICDPDCDVCLTCDPGTGSCVADPAQEGDSCGEFRQCENGVCVCQPVTCTDLKYACGETTDRCGNDLFCGVCGGGLDCCLGQCVDLDTDDLNCGECGNDCVSPQECSSGICSIG